MEIDITHFVKTAEPCEFSASQMELGANAGKITWENAKREAGESPLLYLEAGLGAFRSWVEGFGAWDADEIAAWTVDECNALLIQYISGNLREIEGLCYSDDDEYGIDWAKVEELDREGQISGSIYRGDDGRVYFYMGN